MARKSKRRKITVDNELYYWRAEGNDGCIILTIIHGSMQKVPNASLLWASFLYHEDKELGDHPNHFVVTPYIVAQVVRYGIIQGWTPLEKGKDFCLGFMEGKIDLRLDQNMIKSIKETNSSVKNDRR